MRPSIRSIQPPLRLTLATSQRCANARAFGSAGASLRLKEDHPQDPDELEKVKQSQIKKREWTRELASTSEENVKADQDGREIKEHGKHIEELQKTTAETHGKEHADGGKS